MNPDDAHPSNQQDPQWDELVENFRQLDAAAPREPSAEERKAQLEKLFNTGPAAVRGPRDYEVDDTGEEFDSSWNRGESIQFPLRGLIQGWQDGIPGMKVGGRRELVIPPHLAYGPAGGHFLGGKTLIFVIDLLAVG